MSDCRLKLVRQDSRHLVYTEHPDHIHPRDLSGWLLDKYGADNVKISLKRNIYVIYVDRELTNSVSAHHQSATTRHACPTKSVRRDNKPN